MSTEMIPKSPQQIGLVAYGIIFDTAVCATQRNKVINSSVSGQNGRHFAGDIFKSIFIDEIFCILVCISVKFVPRGPIDNKPALVQVMAWRLLGVKPLPEPMLTEFTDVYMRH